MTLSELRQNRTAAYTGPFIVFMAFKLVSDLIKTGRAGAPWWRTDPEHWVYPIQTLICLALLWWWRKEYRLDFQPCENRLRNAPAIAWGVIAGVVGLVLWLLPGWIFLNYGTCGLPETVAKYLGIFSRHGDGFNPDIFPQGSWEYTTSLAFRFLRMGVAVAILEELFWRGYLWRVISAQHTPKWWTIPFAQPWSIGMWGTILVWPLAHLPTDYLGCIVYGLLISALAIRTRNILACIVCHGVTNVGLGIYVLKTGLWNYW